ncbi:MAG TPA: AAA family ATPase [Chryseolinea sp.]|nr:AAA family ATPase [Chryseolinea sp.]
MNIDINAEFQSILDQLHKTTEHLFITGRAGTGKSTLLQYFRGTTCKKMIVLAPTGVAALNVQGQTIHSFFGFAPQVTPEQAKKEHPAKSLKRIIEELEMIVIDEASMLRADLLDAIDQALRKYGHRKVPFGGKRLIFIGDLYQLPPVVTKDERDHFQHEYASPYFFDAKVFRECQIKTVELEKIYRQQDEGFIRLLNQIRDNSITQEGLESLNGRYDRFYQAFQKPNEVTLCTTNAAADRINQAQLDLLGGKKLKYSGETTGDFIRQLPTHDQLELKIGAQVMLVNNDAARRWVNGSTGIITGTEWSAAEKCDLLLVKLSHGKTVEVLPYTWETNQYSYDEEADTIEVEKIGAFTQYPLKLAWAVTIHKSQGKTFDNVVLDIAKGTFAHGQIYVALSRCTSLEGLILRQALLPEHIWSDQRINYFLQGRNEGQTYRRMTVPEKKEILQKCIDYENSITMTYTTGNGQTFQKNIRPTWIGEMEYQGVEYLAVETQDMETGENRAYSVNRIVTLCDTNSQ